MFFLFNSIDEKEIFFYCDEQGGYFYGMLFMNVLILTASGGAGLLQGAKSKAQEIKDKDPSSHVIIRDIMLSSRWHLIGKIGVWCWNWSQKKGFVGLQKLYTKLIGCAHYIFWLQIFFGVLRILYKEKIDRVIDTQPLGSSATIAALKLYNKKTKKKVFLEKVIVDIPSKDATHFFKNIKRLSKEEKKWLKILSIEPLLETEKTNEEFWQKYCGMPESSVTYETFPIRQGFLSYVGREKTEKPFDISLCISDPNEKKIIDACLEKKPLHVQKTPEGYLFTILPREHLSVLVLGSQPTFTSAVNYLQGFFEIAKKYPEKTFHFFFFASSYTSKQVLFQKVADLVFANCPKNLTVVPFSFQKEEVVAKLYFRADLSITRSAGQTILELMATQPKKRFLHSEAEGTQSLLDGMPIWEAGGARYLEKKLGAVVVTSKTFVDAFSLD